MTTIAVIHYSSTGNVARLGAAAAEAAGAAGAQVRLRRIPELVAEPPTTDRDAWSRHQDRVRDVPVVTPDDLDWADGIMIGTPVRFGLPAAAVLHFIDTTAALSIPGRLAGKVASAFTSGSAAHGGQETTILALHNAFCHWGAVIISTGSTEPVLFRPANGSPYGVSSVSHNEAGNVHADNVAAVEFQARRTVEIAATLVAGRAAIGTGHTDPDRMTASAGTARARA